MQLPKEVIPLLPITTSKAQALSLWVQPGHVALGSLKEFHTRQQLTDWLTGTETTELSRLENDFDQRVLQAELGYTFIFLDTLSPMAIRGLATWVARIHQAGGQLGRLVFFRRLTSASLLRKTQETQLRRRLRKLATALLPDPEQSICKALPSWQQNLGGYLVERVLDGSIKRFTPCSRTSVDATQAKTKHTLNKQLADHAISFAMQPAEQAPTPVHSLLHQIATALAPRSVSLQQILVSQKDKLILFLQAGTTIIGKMTLSDRAALDARHNAAVLKELSPERGIKIPQMLLETKVEEYASFVETSCSGLPLKSLGDIQLEQQIMLQVLTHLRSFSSKHHAADASPRLSLLEHSYQQLTGFLSESQLNKVRYYFERCCCFQTVPLGVVHHDLSQSNVLYDSSENAIAIIDWDESTLEGPLPLNLLSYLFSRCSRQSKNQYDAFKMVLHADRDAERLGAFTQQAYDALGCPLSQHPVWTRLHWLITLAHQVQFDGFSGRSHLSEHTAKIIDHFFDTASSCGIDHSPQVAQPLFVAK
ncbi:phosphotransferase [Alkalimonas delamerensis]|uniref:Phosphotransferase n=1 Tax=Alkalimonas delamerensis TaxID=265981 RepID=A0ABT9GMC4_9GAMM|nr:phosphotransferase [Alkalimonas delamerensis]MDP4528123.1 phosphotransferase [Alkalimonas delamerensis]